MYDTLQDVRQSNGISPRPWGRQKEALIKGLSNQPVSSLHNNLTWRSE